MTSFSGRMTAVGGGGGGGGGAASSSGEIRLRQAIIAGGNCEVNFNYKARRSAIVLRCSERRWRIWKVEASAAGGGAWERSEAREKLTCKYAVGEFAEADEGREMNRTVVEEGRKMNRTVEITLAAAMTVVMGVGNRVLYKLALVPLKNYPFFLAQLATVGYLGVYFSILLFRYRAGIVTDEMLSTPKAPFIAVGLLEALGAAAGMAAGTILAGASIPILSQSFLVWQIILSSIFLGRRYRVNQLLGCFLVAVGVIISVARSGNVNVSLYG